MCLRAPRNRLFAAAPSQWARTNTTARSTALPTTASATPARCSVASDEGRAHGGGLERGQAVARIPGPVRSALNTSVEGRSSKSVHSALERTARRANPSATSHGHTALPKCAVYGGDRGARTMTDIPTRATNAPSTSQRVGRCPSTARSHTSATAM